MIQYLSLLEELYYEGEPRQDRTGTGTKALFGEQLRFDLQKGFPLLTTKKLHLRSIIHELLWFLKGHTNTKYLQENNVRIWDEWASPEGELGPIYGAQWRSFPKPDGGFVDQIKELIHRLKTDPFSRRHLVVSWNPGELEKMALPPCHCLFQFFVHSDTRDQGDPDQPLELSCQLYQRSADIFLGVPFNIASYALLTMMVAKVCGFVPRNFIHTFGDVHLYNNHFEQAQEQLQRIPQELPKVSFRRNVPDIESFKYEDFVLENYNPYPKIKADVSV